MSKATEILAIIRKTIEEHPELGETTPTMYDPDKLDNNVSIGLMEETDKGTRLRFIITVDDGAFGSAFEKDE